MDQIISENIWENQAITKFLKEETAEIKETLWGTSEESVLGKLVKRQGPTKTASEISDLLSMGIDMMVGSYLGKRKLSISIQQIIME